MSGSSVADVRGSRKEARLKPAWHIPRQPPSSSATMTLQHCSVISGLGGTPRRGLASQPIGPDTHSPGPAVVIMQPQEETGPQHHTGLYFPLCPTQLSLLQGAGSGPPARRPQPLSTLVSGNTSRNTFPPARRPALSGCCPGRQRTVYHRGLPLRLAH
ncbi:unnamed protein product [Boreogadus saida]